MPLRSKPLKRNRVRKTYQFETLDERALLAYDICGEIGEDMVWDKTDMPYEVTCDVTIASGRTLTITPGASVHMRNSSSSWIVDGTLNADGVEFTGYTDIRVRDGGTAH
ncbi:MAG: hypothetical protein KDB27_17250, partial [Planctomycetales bacterium]|nr:hypothetical protein [Planctomycetales bacterium]